LNHRLTLTAAVATALASIALYPLFTGTTWFFAGLGAIVAVAATGTLTRLRALPVVLCVAASLLGLVIYLNLAFEAAHSLLFVVPTPASLSDLWHLAGQGITESDGYAPPVPGLPAFLLLGAGGIGIVAAATDLIAVRLRSTAIAGLPLLALFSVPVTTSASRNNFGTTVVFCLGVAGYLALLGADGRERIRLWGRMVTLWRADQGEKAGVAADRAAASTRALAAAGRRVGLASVVLALCVPLLVPGLHVTRLFAGNASFGISGSGGTLSFPDPIAQMNNQLHESQIQTVLRYHTTDPNLTPPYLQLYVLSNLSPTGWSVAPARSEQIGAQLPGAQGLTLNDTPHSPVTTTVSVADAVTSSTSGPNFLPLPYPATRISAPGTWYAVAGSLMVYARSTSLTGLQYTAQSLDLEPTAQELSTASAPPAAVKDSYLYVPPAYQQLKTIAERITRSAKTASDKAAALQSWFTQNGGFKYSLDVSLPDSAAGLDRFLTVTKTGYCQQFAFAMAVLARLLGIPSRIAVGYTAGTSTGNGNWEVKTSDAHAWPELYFQGAGWLRFEPTPTGGATGGQGTATAPAYSIPPALAGPTATPTPATVPGTTTPGNAGSNAGNHHLLPGLAGGTTAGASRQHHSSSTGLIIIALLAFLALALLGASAARLLVRRIRWLRAAADAGRAHAAWRELRDDLTDYRIGYLPSEPPRALARRIARQLNLSESVSLALGRIALAEERARYAAAPGPSGTLRRDSAAVRHGISAASSSAVRWRARVFPTSVITPLAAGAAQVLDVFGWMNTATWRLRSRTLGTGRS
jgi:transglutaminase-like putative cysteine protease